MWESGWRGDLLFCDRLARNSPFNRETFSEIGNTRFKLSL